MNLRSYLRGAGLGLLVAALVLSFSGAVKTKAMTDDEVKARAKELGMTDSNELLTEAYTVTEAPEAAAEPEAPETPEIEVSAGADSEVPADEVSADTVSEETSAEEATKESSAEPASEGSSAEVKKDDSEIIEESLEDKQTTSLKSDVTGEDKKKSELLADAVETEAENPSTVADSSSGFISIHISGGSSSTAVAKELERTGAVDSASSFDNYLCSKGYDRRLSSGDFRIPAGASDEDIALILMKKK